jgi:hypothetical protein
MRHTRLFVPVLALVVLVSAACGPTPAPAPAPTPEPVVAMSINTAFGPFGPAVVAQATRVARCESGWVPTAGAGSYYQGLFQLGRHILAINAYGGNFLNPLQNALAARDLYVSRGRSWSAWACRP